MIRLNNTQKRGLLLFITLLIFAVSGCETVNREDIMKEVKSTDLFNENIDGIGLGMFLIDKNITRKNGHFVLAPDNEYYAPKRDYDEYWNEQIIISVDRKTKEILSISILENNKKSLSAKGIKLGSSIDDAMGAYGENYYVYRDNEQAFYEIGYVDHKNNTMLSFTHFNDKITGITFSYAFDRLNWYK